MEEKIKDLIVCPNCKKVEEVSEGTWENVYRELVSYKLRGDGEEKETSRETEEHLYAYHSTCDAEFRNWRAEDFAIYTDKNKEIVETGEYWDYNRKELKEILAKEIIKMEKKEKKELKTIRTKIGIIGSRKLNEEQKEKAEELIKNLIERLKETEEEIIIVSGGAKGIDSIAEKVANLHGLPTVIFYPDYKRYGRTAPLKRNKLIVEESDILIAIKNKDYESRGTLHTVNQFKKRKPNNKLYFIEI